MRIGQAAVDQFQDTDSPRCGFGAAGLDGGAAPGPGLFLVGDPKQSIYGWRSADLRAYDDFCDLLLRQGGASNRWR